MQKGWYIPHQTSLGFFQRNNKSRIPTFLGGWISQYGWLWYKISITIRIIYWVILNQNWQEDLINEKVNLIPAKYFNIQI